MKHYTLLCPFGGLGAGALGFIQAQSRLFGAEGRFQLLGGVDVDAEACADFEYLTGVPELCADVHQMTAEDVVRAFGPKAPDVVFMSPPCKGASGLLSEKQAKKAKYRKLNRLALAWTKVMLEAWKDAPPRLVLLENVPRIITRARRVLGAVKALLRRHGYVLHEGFHDCGEIGALAQHRRRYLLVARHKASTPQLLYQPSKRRVRACGEVLGTLPLPNDPAAGPMHRLPAIGWLNWVRLALIPAGGDWRDLPGVLDEGQQRREKFKRHAVEQWEAPVGTIGGTGSNGVENVADPRLGRCQAFMSCTRMAEHVDTSTGRPIPVCSECRANSPGYFRGTLGVAVWDAPAGTVTGGAAPSRGTFSVADPRPFKGQRGVKSWGEPASTVAGESLPSNGAYSVADPRVTSCQRSGPYGVIDWQKPSPSVIGSASIDNTPASIADPRIRLRAQDGANVHHNKYAVADWQEPARTVIGATRPGSGGPSVADPRVAHAFGNVLRVVPWDEPVGTVTHSPAPSSGGAAVADPRVKVAFDHGYRVTPWGESSPTIAAGSHPGQGAYSVADPRVDEAALVGLLTLDDARATVTGEIATPFAIVDPSSDGAPVMLVRDVAKAPPAAPVILAADGTWHRPLTTLELAVLQGLPAIHNGAPLQLAGKKTSAWRERIGNAVPVGAAQAIAEQMLLTLLASDAGAFALSSAGGVWVEPHRAERLQ